jgi:hypothetical protein
LSHRYLCLRDSSLWSLIVVSQCFQWLGLRPNFGVKVPQALGNDDW